MFRALVAWFLTTNCFLSQGIPIRGNFPWTVLLCKFYDVPFEPQPPSYFTTWLTDVESEGSVARFFADISNGLYTIKGSNVFGWYTMPYRRQAVQFLAQKDSYLNKLYPDENSQSTVQLKAFHKTKELCIETAKNLNYVLFPNVIIIVNDESVAMYCKDAGVLLTPHYLATAALTHEMVHSFNIGHSHSDRQVRVFPYAELGEYDDTYDLMSTANAYMYPSSYGLNGPGLSGPHLDYLGWLPMNRTLWFGGSGYVGEATLDLASLSIPHNTSTGWLLVMIPFDSTNLRNVYTIELRTRVRVDQGVKRDAVIIHKILDNNGHSYSYLVTNGATGRYEWLPGETFRAPLNPEQTEILEIRIIEIKPSENTASVYIKSTLLLTGSCPSGQVHRNAFPNDTICVSPEERDLIQEENANASLYLGSMGICLGGRVFRSAGPGDNAVCVTKERKAVVDAQTAQAGSSDDPKTWGLNSCKPGFIWRAVDMYDYICVTQEYKDSLSENARECSAPWFIRRFLFPSDKVCVRPEDRDKALEESSKGRERMAYYKFFNGNDEV